MAQAQQPLTATEVSALFPAATPHSNIARYWPYISSALAEEGIGDRAMALLALATIRAESEGFEPIDEHPSAWNTAPGGYPYGLYDERRDLGNLGSGDGEAFRGRGFVQLTGRDNYARYGEQIGVDLLKRPELANDPEVAAHYGEVLWILGEQNQARQVWRDALEHTPDAPHIRGVMEKLGTRLRP